VYQLLSTVINCYQQLSTFINCYQQLSTVINTINKFKFFLMPGRRPNLDRQRARSRQSVGDSENISNLSRVTAFRQVAERKREQLVVTVMPAIQIRGRPKI
jgi:hypothetical protein